MTGRGSGGNYSGFGDVFRSDIPPHENPPPAQAQGYWPCGGPGPGPIPGHVDNVYYHQHQQVSSD